MFNYKGIPCACPYCCGVDLVKPGYPNKLVLKLTVSLLLLWFWSLHDHLPVFIWLWLSLSLLLKSLKEHSLQPSTYSRFISGIKRRLIYGGCFFFSISVHFLTWHIDLNLNIDFCTCTCYHKFIYHFIKRSVVVGFSHLSCGRRQSGYGGWTTVAFFPPPCTLDLSIRYVT